MVVLSSVHLLFNAKPSASPSTKWRSKAALRIASLSFCLAVKSCRIAPTSVTMSAGALVSVFCGARSRRAIASRRALWAFSCASAASLSWSSARTWTSGERWSSPKWVNAVAVNSAASVKLACMACTRECNSLCSAVILSASRRSFALACCSERTLRPSSSLTMLACLLSRCCCQSLRSYSAFCFATTSALCLRTSRMRWFSADT
mmetsp:Transcript_121172/g.342854  ORF Transcript_121172/g.342854 Transcript_121172/m.342854 type:complete len:205 (+) Transcript_121172:797-1411(+)